MVVTVGSGWLSIHSHTDGGMFGYTEARPHTSAKDTYTTTAVM